jgi:molybdenum cofactor cytidylyltransferase
MLQAVILAAGASSRMGRPKALLPHPRGGTLLRAICEALRAAGAGRLLVVVAEPHGPQVAEEAEACGAQVVWNPRPQDGQASSLRLGLEAAQGPAAVALVDQPPPLPSSLRALFDAATREPLVAHVPTFEGAPGHPFVVPASFLLALKLSRTARDALQLVQVRRHELPDPGLLLDLDTPEQLSRFQEAAS